MCVTLCNERAIGAVPGVETRSAQASRRRRVEEKLSGEGKSVSLDDKIFSWVDRRLGAPQPPYWFRPKRFGLGWGLPSSREGWLCMAPMLVGLVIGLPITPFAPAAGSAVLLGGILIGLPLSLWGAIVHGDPKGRTWSQG